MISTSLASCIRLLPRILECHAQLEGLILGAVHAMAKHSGLACTVLAKFANFSSVTDFVAFVCSVVVGVMHMC